MGNRNYRVMTALLAVLAGCSGGGTAPVTTLQPAARVLCAAPLGGWESRDPAELGFDAAKLQAAVDWALPHTSGTVAVYRHGCLAAQSTLDTVATADQPFDGWSMTKSVTAMVVGRAVTLGLFDLDQPVGEILPETNTEAGHGRLTARHLLTMTGGLHKNYVRDFALPLPDRVCDALDIPFDFAPGTTWQYQQVTLDLLLWAIEKKTGRDIQEFAQAELFGPLGIAADSYTWDRDPHGHTNAWAHLHMPNANWARLGQLMLQGGQWNGQQLLSADYLRQALSRVADNPAYGFLFWLNGGPWWRVPDVEGPDTGEGSVMSSAPPDTYGMFGLGEQRTYIIPSRDLVIVRLGERGSHDPDTRVLVWSGRSGEIDHELVRRVLLAVTDVPYTDPGPYVSAGAHPPPIDQGLYQDATDAQENLDGMSTPACH